MPLRQCTLNRLQRVHLTVVLFNSAYHQLRCLHSGHHCPVNKGLSVTCRIVTPEYGQCLPIAKS